ncbi:Glyoxylase, beta-lactamase superfamily II [Pasteurella testudinis DSM 23072]|uniref:Glyoxylase, beta-lactamase superfamily II n=1 Tax=Pasteurella testudinis DSM 23072 TaxID=1122938 RepID=A0A1W1V2F0_9PAST|nr:MBL fold metallo-hydrolase [Pasteurella testudinis]SMB87201.1 Glyoxylase, beta-lactamase superfamily II [Pasteurella testudinis DSM 23072]SUB50861.1 Arsenate reductase and related proteins, glutaredoxin family [Pasteurella testudinis]
MNFKQANFKQALVLTALLSTALGAQADELKLSLFNPQANSVMPVSSVIVEGDNEVLLVDAQFQRNDAEILVEQIKATGKPLKTIFISHSDPDYYFGLDVITHAFPDAKVLATPETAKRIRGNIIGKADFWSPILADNAPRALVLPQPTDATALSIGTSQIEIKNLDHDPAHTYLWIDELKTILGGVSVYDNLHVWVADDQTEAERKTWLNTLNEMQQLAPKSVIAGHSLGTNYSPASLDFTKTYLQQFEAENKTAKNSAELIEAMKKHYPNLGEESSLELGAKVVKGEEKWPQ